MRSHKASRSKRVRQGDGLCPLLFNCVLEKVVREWRKELTNLGVENGVYLSYKKEDLKVDCLALADDMALIAESMETAAMRLNCLRRQAPKAVLQVSLEKTEYFTHIKEADKEMLLDTLVSGQNPICRRNWPTA